MPKNDAKDRFGEMPDSTHGAIDRLIDSLNKWLATAQVNRRTNITEIPAKYHRDRRQKK
jgi:hypothetical protein